MEKNTQLPEVLIASSDKKLSAMITRLKKEEKIRKIAARVYTSNMTDTPESIVGRNLYKIIGQLYPGALISHRSAFELRPSAEGHFYLTHAYTKNITLPGVTLHLIAGPKPIDIDIPYLDGLFISNPARAYLENLQLGYVRNGISKCLPQANLEQRLQKKLLANGENELNRLRDQARKIAADLKMEKEFRLLDKIIGAILSTRDAEKTLQSESAKAWAAGEPYDPQRVELFTSLFEQLANKDFKHYPDINTTEPAYKNFAFFESYFSNYIEGTEFEVEEAKQIVDTGVAIPARDEDSHDVLGTFYITSNRKEMSILPKDPDEMINILQRRHSILLSARPSKSPGLFKEQKNKAGNSHFVDYRLVRGTLKKGFEVYRAIQDPVARAYFILFMISEVHPFTDGNGRISRIMMNAELSAAGMSKIIIPTVYRIDYIDALKRLTQNGEPATIIRAMERVRLFSSGLDGSDYDALKAYLEQCNAFRDEQEYILRF
ncbi:MAG: Fic family protein [Bacteroidales bacterium]|nr:Fic family protein [Bacteroidales bacterium]